MRFPFRRERPPIRQAHIQDDNEYSFRRSRTLTGTSSNDVKAVVSDRGQLKSSRLKHHELKIQRRKLVGALCGILLLAGVGTWLLDSFVLQTDSYQTSSPAIVIQESQRQALSETIERYYSERPAERFSFALDEQSLSEYVGAAHPEVASITPINLPGLAAHDFDVQFRRPTALWEISSKRYYVDADGQVFSQNYYTEPRVTVTDRSGAMPRDETAVASRLFLQFLGQLVARIESQQLGKVTDVTLPPGTLRQLDVKLEGRDFDMYTNMDREVVAQVADMAAALRHIDKTQVTPEYLDLRVEGKAFYR